MILTLKYLRKRLSELLIAIIIFAKHDINVYSIVLCIIMVVIIKVA